MTVDMEQLGATPHPMRSVAIHTIWVKCPDVMDHAGELKSNALPSLYPDTVSVGMSEGVRK